MHGYCLYQGLRNFFCQIVNISAFAGYLVFVATTQFCQYSTEAAFNNSWTNGRGYVPIKLYIKKQERGRICPAGHSLPTPGLWDWMWRPESIGWTRVKEGRGEGEESRADWSPWPGTYVGLSLVSSLQLQRCMNPAEVVPFMLELNLHVTQELEELREDSWEPELLLVWLLPHEHEASQLQLCLVLWSWLTFWV